MGTVHLAVHPDIPVALELAGVAIVLAMVLFGSRMRKRSFAWGIILSFGLIILGILDGLHGFIS